MSYHALVIDDNPEILEDIKERLESLGHTCDCVTCLSCARKRLASGGYSYILLDLEIPVRYGRKSRIVNGQNLLREVRGLPGYAQIPIIVMTSHGHDSPDLAVEVLRGNGAVDYVKKPFSYQGRTLEVAIRSGLKVSGRSRPGAAGRSEPEKKGPPRPFESGEMLFSRHRVELCGVKVCGGLECGLIRRVLNLVREKDSRGRRSRYSGDELAQLTGCPRGQNGIAEVVRGFRDHVCHVMLEEQNILMDRLRDIIVNDRRYGYQLSEKISVRVLDKPETEPQTVVTPLEQDAADEEDDPQSNERQRWALQRMRAGVELRKGDLIERFGCSTTTAERDLRDLRRRGRIVFVGPARAGYWRVVR